MIAVAETPAPLATAFAAPAAPRARLVTQRFTIDGDEALERHLEQTCARVLSGISGLIPAGKLEAVLLGGGYGRGEGGVRRGPEGNLPYNDLEFYVAIRGSRHLNERRFERRLHVLGEILTQLAGVEVEFKITSLAELRRRPVSMFSYDLMVGHRLVWSAGGPEIFNACDHHTRAEEIPADEGTRLLMNRFAGLIFARERLQRDTFTPNDADFVRRNMAKAQLAMGDAVLTALGHYHWSCRERAERLECFFQAEETPWAEKLLRYHAEGVKFKLTPTTGVTDRAVLREQHAAVSAFALRCWLWLEARRLGRTFTSARAYALAAGDKGPRSASPIFNLLLNLRADNFRLHLASKPWRHPRQRIFRTLAVLLWDPAALSDRRLHTLIERDLNARVTTWSDAVRAFERLWVRVR